MKKRSSQAYHRVYPCRSNPCSSSRAQVTLFLIVGFILIAGALTVIYYVDLTSAGPKEIEQKVVEIPVEYQPIRNFIENCIMRVATEGMELLGQQGGYIDLEKSGLAENPNPTESETVEHPPGSGNSVAYWWFLKSDNACTEGCAFETKRPSLYRDDGEPSLEGQMDTYINENLGKCLKSFAPLAEAGFTIKEKGSVAAKTTVTGYDIVFDVTYPLEVTKVGSIELSSFFVRLPINIKRIYEQATSLTNIEIEQHYLERVMLKLLVAFSDIDEDKLPPMGDMEFKFGSSTYWIKSDVRENVKNMLGIYIQAIQVYNSLNYQPVTIIGEPRREAMYNRGMLVPATPDAEELKIFFSYLPWWDIYFDMNCDGEICRPESIGTDLLPVVGVQRYKFLYDVSFPALVEVIDPAALNNKGYKLQFMLEANLRNNEEMTKDFYQLEGLSVRQSSQLCDINKRNSGNVTVMVVEEGTNKGVSDAQVVYTCAKESCFIGSTDFNGTLTERFPICLGGFVSFVHPEYLKRAAHLTTRVDEGATIGVALSKQTEILFEVKKMLLKKQGGFWNLDPLPLDLDAQESATLIFTRIGQENDDDHVVAGDFKKGEESKVSLYPGLYQIQMHLATDRHFTFKKEICTKPNLWGGCDEKTPLEVEFNKSMIIGGVLLNYTFTPATLSAGKMTFFALSPDIVNTPQDELDLEDIGLFSQMDTYSQIYLTAIQPRAEPKAGAQP